MQIIKKIALYGLAAIGASILGIKAFKCIAANANKLGNIKKLKLQYPGKWAVVVTGNDAIGIAYIDELLNQKYSVLVISIEEEINILNSHTIANNNQVDLSQKTIQPNELMDKISTLFEAIETSIGIIIINSFDFAPYKLDLSQSEAIERSMAINTLLPMFIYETIKSQVQYRDSKMLVVSVSNIAIKPRWLYYGTYSAGKATTEVYINKLHNEFPTKIDALSVILPMKKIQNPKKAVVNHLEQAGKMGRVFAENKDRFQYNYWNHRYLNESRHDICKSTLQAYLIN